MTGILFIVPSLRRAGAETQVIDLINELDSVNLRKHLLVFEKDQSQIGRVNQKSVTFHHVQRRYKYDLGFVWKISKIIDLNKIDVIHCTTEFSLLVGFLARLRSIRKPALVAVIHTTIQLGLKQKLQERFIYRRLLRTCSAVVFVCRSQLQYWISKCAAPNEKSHVIYNGVDVDKFNPDKYSQAGLQFRSKMGIPDTAFVICCIAGFRPEKAHYHIIRGFTALPGNVWLVLAGEGKLRASVEQQVYKAGLDDRVIFTGNLPDVRPLLAASDISLLASTAVETFSLAMLESMSMEVPMIASDIGGLGEAIIPGVTGALFPPGDVTTMHSLLKSMSQDRSLVKEMGVQARNKVISDFSVHVMVKQTEDLLYKVAGRKCK